MMLYIAVFNIRNCTGDIRDSTFSNSEFQGKGVIYQYCKYYIY